MENCESIKPLCVYKLPRLGYFLIAVREWTNTKVLFFVYLWSFFKLELQIVCSIEKKIHVSLLLYK